MSRRTLIGIALAASLVLAGCTGEDEPPVQQPAPQQPGPGGFRLVAYSSCDELAQSLRDAAKASVGPWGLGEAPLYGGIPEGARAAAGDVAAPAAGKALATPDFSQTNVHEAGVDEPDTVKTDGKRIVTVVGNTLRVVDAASHRQTGKLRLDGWDARLLLSGDRALVLMNRMEPGRADSVSKIAPQPSIPEVWLVDLAGAPRVISKYRGEGGLLDARQTGDTARIVLSRAPRITFPQQETGSDRERINANRKAIDKAGADAWLPGWTVTTGGTVRKGRVGCGDVSRPSSFSGRSVVTVLTFGMAAAELDDGRPVSVVADGDTVYGTPTSLYVANDQRWRMNLLRTRGGDAADQKTEIYRFEMPAGAPPVYRAAGSVPGWLVNQYAMSEWDGHLRVATTDDRKQSSAVRVLDMSLRQVGAVTGLGKDERIYSVRFIGPRGYVVTFRQTDPLYSVDLTDPARPRVTGELKITGYSSHLQPVGEDRLIGIGQEADTNGRTQGMQVSLFDVKDPAAPRRLAQHHVSGGYSDAEYDPHAILWWPKTSLLVLPMSSAAGQSTLALRVTGDALEKAGTIEGRRMPEGYAAQATRSLVIGDELWTLSEPGLTVTALSTLKPITFVPAA